ncbi:AraC family transcriptional regulator [Azoarcus olearius]|uniref:GlxA family transcriptional regulator n=1 Tax=Azoarcus sp. (strain BH72) TaxID=418699 RepID=UPI0008060D66|nr:helix-turn-helix domain-containing protein [Azoarcus olearius]ANQ86984.1 AraC family transcriptional regulator [Azoarcus olearius]
MRTEPPLPIAILAMAETTASTLYGMYDLFMSAGRDWPLLMDGTPGAPLFAPVVVSREGRPLRAANGVTLTPDRALVDCPPPAAVCVPELAVVPGESIAGRFPAEIDWLRACHAGGSLLATACSGAVMLAEAGLLDGEDATTHWGFCAHLAREYPAVTVHPQRALVAAGEGQRLVMAGGGTTWLDLALYLIARLAGVDEAMHVARLNLIDWHHSGQQPFARLARSRQAEDALIADCQAWIADNYQRPTPVAAMVARSGLPERSFKRRFQLATGMSPMEYVHTLRLEEAKQMLEASTLAVEAVALELGYEDASFFNRLFRREVGLTPAAYRRRFGGMRRALQAVQTT